MTATIRRTRNRATVEKTLYFGGQPMPYLVRPLPTTCRTDHSEGVFDHDGCGGTGWLCPTCREGFECVKSDNCMPGTHGAISCSCPAGQAGNWSPA